MSNQIVVGHYEPDGELIYLPIGFKPDFFFMAEHGASAPLVFYWWGRMEDDEATNSKEGIKDDGDGTLSKPNDDALFAAYDTGTDGPTVTVWSAGLTVVARTAGAHGTYIKPTTSATMSREAIFEVVTNTTTGTTEPTWPAGIGEQVADNHGSPVVYERVNVPLERVGYQGVRISATPQTDGQEMYYMAIQADRVIDHGDVVGWTGGVYGA